MLFDEEVIILRELNVEGFDDNDINIFDVCRSDMENLSDEDNLLVKNIKLIFHAWNPEVGIVDVDKYPYTSAYDLDVWLIYRLLKSKVNATGVKRYLNYYLDDCKNTRDFNNGYYPFDDDQYQQLLLQAETMASILVELPGCSDTFLDQSIKQIKQMKGKL